MGHGFCNTSVLVRLHTGVGPAQIVSQKDEDQGHTRLRGAAD